MKSDGETATAVRRKFHDRPPESRNLEARARERLDPSLYDYIAGGAGDEWTLNESRVAWNRWQLLPRMLRGVVDRTLATTDGQS